MTKMPTLLSRLRPARHQKPVPVPTTTRIETDLTRRDRHDAQSSPDASPDSPSQNVELDSKIHPDLSALFASVEDALKTKERDTEEQKRKYIYDDGEHTSENEHEDKGTEGETPERKSLDDRIFYASFESMLGPGWSTFGREENASLNAVEKTHITTKSTGAISANFRPSSTDAVLSWSPPMAVESLESLRPSASSHSSPALQPSLEAQLNAQHSSHHSPSPGTFGNPSPAQFTSIDSPAFPPPVFTSTPKHSASQIRKANRSAHTTPTRIPLPGVGLPPLPSNLSRMNRAKSDQPTLSKRRASAPVRERTDRERRRISSILSANSSRIPRRRKSAEWNARAASAGVNADPRQTTEFGWPAEVSREILRLSLGEHAMAHSQDTPSSRRVLTTGPEKADGITAGKSGSKRGGPRVSHELKDNARQSRSRLIRSSFSDQRFSSAHLYSTPLPHSSSTSSAPGRNDRPHSSVVSRSNIPALATHSAPESRSEPLSENALDVKVDKTMGAAGTADHKRSDSNNRIEWDSHEVQEFLSREDGLSDLHLITPMKQSVSESTYETAGSSSFLHAPSLSVIAPTPHGSPARSKDGSGLQSEVADGLQVPTPPPQTDKAQTDKTKGKRKAEESEDGSPPDLRGSKGKKTTFVDVTRSHSNSNASHAPSSFQSFHSQKSRKRVRLSSPMATPDLSRAGSAAVPHHGSVSSRGSSRSAVPPQLSHSDNRTNPPRPGSRASRTSRAMSAAASAASSGAGSVPFPKRRSLSQSSIPLSAIVAPRAPSIDRLSAFHMRDPHRPPPRREVGWGLRFSSLDEKGSPFMAWAFWFGFLLPMLWWLASFWRIPETRMVGTDTEKAVIVDDPYYEREARTWRLRCRIASVVFFVTYAPVIILLAIFA